MSALNFPNSPSNGDTYSANGLTYSYNSSSTKWVRTSPSVGAQGASGPTGAQGATGPTGSSGSATLTSVSNNRVMTAVSGTTLNAESQLTFDGTNLYVGGYARQNNLIHFDVKLTSGTSSGTIKFNSVQENVGSGYNTGTGYFTAPIAGVYCFTGALLQTNSSGQFDVNIRYNGATSTKGQSMRIAGVGNHTTLQITETLKMNANDYVYIDVSSGSVHIGGSGNWTGWQGTLLG